MDMMESGRRAGLPIRLEGPNVCSGLNLENKLEVLPAVE